MSTRASKKPAPRRTAKPAPPAVDPTLARDFWQDTPLALAEQAAHQARLCRAGRERLDVLTERCVRLGRGGGLSWDKLGAMLDVPGETLRRRFGAV
jgi:hypothetical protein